MDWAKLAARGTELIAKRAATDEDYRRLLAQNNALAAYIPNATHSIEATDNAMQNAGVRPDPIPSNIIR